MILAYGTSAVEDEVFFPQAHRVHFKRAPLKQVICQFRFPTIYRIQSELPAEYQERIRGSFPLSEQTGVPFHLGCIPSPALSGLPNLINTAHRFFTEDKTTFIELNLDSLTYSTTSYYRWDDSKSFIDEAVKALLSVYKPSFYTRIGLRYSNVISKSSIGMGEKPWSQLLSPPLVGELSESKFENNIEELQKSIRVRSPDKKGGILLQHGLYRASQPPNDSYFIDFDYYVDTKTELDNAAIELEHLHRLSGNAFRWSLTDILYHALEPQPL